MSALLRLLSLACSLVLLVSFGMFASEQAGHSSKKTVAEIGANDDTQAATSASPAPAQPKKEHSGFRKAVDSVNDKLVGPFKGIGSSDSPWAQHIIQTLLAFLLFGVGIGFAARYASTKGV